MIANCRNTIGLMSAFVDSALTAQERQSLESHFAVCPRCVEFVESYRGTSRIIRKATDVDVPPDVEERLLESLASRRR